MAATPILTKTCNKCLEVKPQSEFYSHIRAKDGCQAACKMCCKALTAEYRLAHPEKIKAASLTRHAGSPEKLREASAAYRRRHPERVKSSQAAHMAANPGRHQARAAAWRAANPDQAKATAKLWRAANPEAGRIKAHNRRAKKMANGGTLSKGLSAKLFGLQKGLCPCCQQPLGDKPHLDHIMPLALGGSNDDGNIQLLRAQCNQRKSAKHPIDYMQSKGFLL